MMGQADMETVIKNLDHRVEGIEQILPTLATRAELQAAIAPLATREEMRAAIREAVAPLPTRDEMHATIRSESERTRTYIDQRVDETHTFMKVLTETVRDDIRLLAEGQVGLREQIAELRTEVKAEIKGLDQRVTRLEASRSRRR